MTTTRKTILIAVATLVVGAALGAGGVYAAGHGGGKGAETATVRPIESRAEYALNGGLWFNARVRECTPWNGAGGQWQCVIENPEIDSPYGDLRVRFFKGASGELIANADDVHCWESSPLKACGPEYAAN